MDDPNHTATAGELPTKVLAALVVAAVALMAGGALGLRALPTAMMVLFTDGVMAAAVLAAGTGFGWSVVRLLVPHQAPPMLALATAAMLGLWMLSLAVLAAGTLAPAALSAWVLWPVIGTGVALAIAFAHRPLGRIRLPGRLGGDSLVWLAVGVAGGLWLAGAVVPPGWLGRLTGPAGDAAAVTGRYLQLPREFLCAGRVTGLDHNVFSHGPLMTEMLGLLGMVLRGGAYEGTYLARFIGGLFAVDVLMMVVFAGILGWI